jgi:ppGpp synthetase/RelA/SpoT-type nucleotidyltranferase
MTERSIVNRLREEYFDLLPEVRRIVNRLETEIRFHTRDIQQSLKPYEQLIVKSRIKECQSALDTAQRKGNKEKGEGKVFDPERPGDYSVLSLPDLAGVRVLVFPDRRLTQVNEVLREKFEGWQSKPVRDSKGVTLAHKYYGRLLPDSEALAEYQIVPMLLGLYWEVEHSARYKSDLKGSDKISDLNAKVESALSDFERGIADLLPDDSGLDSEA